MKKGIIFGLVFILAILSVLVVVASSRRQASQEEAIKIITDNAVQPMDKMTKPEVKLPTGIPTDVSAFPNAKLIDVIEIEPGNDVALTYEIEASKFSPKQVMDYYTDELTKQGYKVDQPVINEAAGNYITGGKKGSVEFRAINYLLPDNQSKTSININISGYSKK
jgi:hypothetical protein